MKLCAILLLALFISFMSSGCTISKTDYSTEETNSKKVGRNEAGEITVSYNGKQTVLKSIFNPDNKCLLISGKEFVEFLGLFAEWDSSENTLAISDGVTRSAVQEGNPNANVNGKRAVLEEAPVMKEGDLYIPVSFIGDIYGFNISMDDAAVAITITENTARETADAQDNVETIDNDIIGFWSSIESFHGELVDVVSGISQGSPYAGEWFLFREDGTYQYVIIGAGSIISGAATKTGKFSVDGNKILLYDSKESWYPDISRSGQKEAYKNKPVDDEQGEFSFGDDGNTLKISFMGSSRLNRVSE